MSQRRCVAQVGLWLAAMALVVMLAPAAAQSPPDPPPEPPAATGGGEAEEPGDGGEGDEGGGGEGAGEADAKCKAPCVSGAGPLKDGKIAFDDRIVVGEPFAVVVAGLEAWLEGAGSWTDVRLVLNDRAVESLEPVERERDLQALVFNLGGEFERDTSKAWQRLVDHRDGIEAKAAISVGFKGQAPLPTTVDGKTVVLMSARLGWLAAVFVFLVIVALVWLAVKKGMLSDSGKTPVNGKKPYSLGRCQTAWWFVLILGSYLFMCLMSGSIVTMPGSVLGLMGIASGTFLGAELVNSNREPPKQTPRSKGFLKDLLSSGGEVTFHRFQMFVWTLALGGIFIVRVVYHLEMPEFDGTLLGLMGVSNGTFLGMKIPEGSK